MAPTRAAAPAGVAVKAAIAKACGARHTNATSPATPRVKRRRRGEGGAGLLLSGGIQPARPDAGEVTKLLNTDLPGSLDSAGYSVPLVGGVPGEPITVMIEVKNIRGWMYPHSVEIYQLLHKACVLQGRPGELMYTVPA